MKMRKLPQKQHRKEHERFEISKSVPLRPSQSAEAWRRVSRRPPWPRRTLFQRRVKSKYFQW